jgi:ketosteroid isomerase-like protein
VDARTEQEIRDLVARWDEAMIGNDPNVIGSFMAEEWVIIGPDGSVDGKERFLALIAAGELSHDVMTTRDLQVRGYGQTAVTVASGTSGGRFRGTPFLLTERASCVFVKDQGRWVCVLTHLSALSDASA